MKKWLKTALLLLLIGCNSPDKKTQVTVAPEEVTDTALATEKDGVVVDEPVLTQTEEMPPHLENQLNQHYPGWQLPEIPESYKQSLGLTDKNNFWVKGDFDGNGQEDFAALVRLRDSVYVTAFLQQKRRDSFTAYTLERNPTYKTEELPAASLHYLGFLARNDTVYNYQTERREKLPSDAISVGMEYAVKAYYFRNGKWKVKEIGD